MKYWLTTLGLIYTIDATIPYSKPSSLTFSSAATETPTKAPTLALLSTHTSMKREEIDYYCCDRILSGLVDAPYDIYYE